MALMGVPTMTKASFVLIEHSIGGWWELFQKSMKAAGRKKNITIAWNNFHQNVPAITVIIDSG